MSDDCFESVVSGGRARNTDDVARGEFDETMPQMFQRFVRLVDNFKVQHCEKASCRSKRSCTKWHHSMERRFNVWNTPHLPAGFSVNKTATSYHPNRFKTELCVHKACCPFGQNCAFLHKDEPRLKCRSTTPTRREWVEETWEAFVCYEREHFGNSCCAYRTAYDANPPLAAPPAALPAEQNVASAAPTTTPPSALVPQFAGSILDMVPTPCEPTHAPNLNQVSISLSQYETCALGTHGTLKQSILDLVELLCDSVEFFRNAIVIIPFNNDHRLAALAATRIRCLLNDLGEDAESVYVVPFPNDFKRTNFKAALASKQSMTLTEFSEVQLLQAPSGFCARLRVLCSERAHADAVQQAFTAFQAL